jgi:signal transduction histidine kinase
MVTRSPTATRTYTILFWVTVVTGLFLVSRVNYLLFHALVESFAIVVAAGIFMIAWNSRRFQDNGYFLFVGIGSLCVAGIDLLHFLAYKNMGVFPGATANLPTQLWIAARSVQAVTLAAAPLFLVRRVHSIPTLISFVVATGLLLASIFVWPIFPDCYREGEGLTLCKKVSEYVISGLLLVALVLTRRRPEAFSREVLRMLSLALGVLIAAELAFTLYLDVFGYTNMVGHLLKLVGFTFIYQAVIVTGLARPYELLFRELKASEESLAARNVELESSNRDLEAFTSTVSHDLRSPLTTIGGYLGLLQNSAPLLDSQEVTYLKEASAGVFRMSRIISDLLKFAQLGRQPLQKQPVDLSALAEEILLELQASASQRRATIVVSEGVTCTGDPGLLRVALANLLGNAWKFTRKVPEPRIEFGVRQEGGKPVYFVRDNGAGFDPAEAQRIFAPFERLHDSEEFEGTGIGLATVQRIIERHGGRIWAEGEEGKGATFSFSC